MSKAKKREHALLNAAPGTVYMQYKVLGTKGEGTFSQVLKARSLKNGKVWKDAILLFHCPVRLVDINHFLR